MEEGAEKDQERLAKAFQEPTITKLCFSKQPDASVPATLHSVIPPCVNAIVMYPSLRSVVAQDRDELHVRRVPPADDGIWLRWTSSEP